MKVSLWPVLVLAVAFALLPAVAAGQGAEVIKTVVIDPGHGGRDAGAVFQGGKYKEKDIVLDVGLRLGRLIREHYPSVKVIYTRSTDVFIELDQRSQMANKAGADLLFSIHTNSNKGTPASGTETFIMSTDPKKTSGNLAAVMRENDVISLESDYTTKYMGYQPGSAESYIIFQLMQYAYYDQSLALARCVQRHYKKDFKLADRGVKDGPLFVLCYSAMPSILTELGFINNENDLKLMITEAGRERYARTLFNAFSEYKTRTDGRGQVIVLGNDASAEGTQDEALAQTGPAPQTAQDAAPADPADAAANTAAISPAGVTFAVQVRLSPKSLSADDPCFGVYRGKVSEKKIGAYYKYFIGETASYREAANLQAEARRTIRDAFLVAFRDGAPIAVKEALELIK